MSTYLLSAQPAELERLQLQARVWEPAGRALLATLPRVKSALDVGCGALGWLVVLGERAENVTGSDIDPKMLAHAREAAPHAELVQDDLFASKLPEHAFDLVHARFQLAPLGRAEEQLAAYRRLLAPGGWLVLEEPDTSSWAYDPRAPSAAALVDAIRAAFRAAGGNFDAGCELPALLKTAGLPPVVTRQVVTLETGHPYLRLPLQFATSLRPRMEAALGKPALDLLVQNAEAELARPGVSGTTFTLVQCVVGAPP
jgi:SAM-dependent methyltransferase